MNVKQIIDNALSQGDNVPESDAAYVERRRRALIFLREVFDETWWARDWPTKKEEATLTIPALQAAVALPHNYESLGNFGGVFLLDDSLNIRYKMVEVPEDVLWEHRATSRQVSTPEFFSIYDMSADAYGHRHYKINFETNAEQFSVKVLYQRNPEKLLDAGDPDAATPYTVSTLTASGLTASATTSVDHDFEFEDRVIIAGANEAAYNGTFEVSPTDGNTFDYTLTAAPSGSPATGSITATIDIDYYNNALDTISFRWHNTVLLPALKAKLRESKGDDRWKYHRAQYEVGLATMKKTEQRFQGDPKRLPSFFGSRRSPY